MIADGGSSDKTVEIARSLGFRVFPNPRRLADYGQQICASNATGEYYVIWAADNELIDPNWLKEVEMVFESHPEVAVLWGRMKAGASDPRINRYYELIQSEPITFFVNKNLEQYVKQARKDTIMGKPCYIFDVNPRKSLVWGANGLVYRTRQMTPILLQDRFIGDNDLFQEVIESGFNTVAYVPTLCIEHHTLKSLKHWIVKLVRKHREHTIARRGSDRNLGWLLTDNFVPLVFVFALYSLVPSASVLDSLHKAVRDRNTYWFYHPLVSFAQAAILVSMTVGSMSGLRLLARVARSSGSKDIGSSTTMINQNLPRETPQ